MEVYLKAGGMLKDYLRPDVDPYTRRVEASEGQTLRQILESVGLPPGHVAMAFVEGRLVNLAYTPKEGDVVTLRPPVQGG
jgi:sulfur carrier protein ThiS